MFLWFVFDSSAVGVGFYGNSQTNDGVYQLTYSLYNANHTLGSINNLVSEAHETLLCITSDIINNIQKYRGTDTLHFNLGF